MKHIKQMRYPIVGAFLLATVLLSFACGQTATTPTPEPVPPPTTTTPSPPTPPSSATTDALVQIGGGVTGFSDFGGTLPGVSLFDASGADVARIVVNGTAEVFASPDVATIRFATKAENASAATARDRASTAKDNLVRALRAGGIAEDDISSNFSLYSSRPWDPERQMPGDIVYNASFNVVAVVRDIDTLGMVLDEAIDNTNNTTSINSINYSSSEGEKFLDMARQAAVRDASARANLYATELNVGLGTPLQLVEIGASGAVARAVESAPLAFAADSGSGISIEPGQVSFSATVQVSYAIVVADS